MKKVLVNSFTLLCGFILVVTLAGISLAGDVVVQEGKMQVKGLEALYEAVVPVSNGNFDNGLTDWTVEAGIWLTGQDENGSYVEGDKNETISQNVGALANTMYEIKVTNLGQGAGMNIKVELGGVQQTVAASWPLGTTTFYINTTSGNGILKVTPLSARGGNPVRFYGVEVQKLASALFSKIEANNIKFSSLNSANAAAGTGQNSLSLGNNTLASGNYSLAAGDNSYATGSYSTAMGSYSEASGSASIAMGGQSTASASNSIALGWQNTASSFFSIAVGANSTASGNSGIAIGRIAKAVGNGSAAIGYSVEAQGANSISMGKNSVNSIADSLAVGFANWGEDPRVDFRVRRGLVDVYGNMNATGTVAANAYSADGQSGIDATITIKDGDGTNYHHFTFKKGILTGYIKDTNP